MEIHKCDVISCGKVKLKEEIFNLIIYRKGVSRKAGNKACNHKDICKDCWHRLFGN